MSWGEGVRLVRLLAKDPTSQTCVAIQGLDHPITREALALYDLYDLTGLIHAGKKFDLHTRPFKVEGKRDVQRHGNTGGRTREEVIAILNAHGHNLS